MITFVSNQYIHLEERHTVDEALGCMVPITITAMAIVALLRWGIVMGLR